MRILNNLQLTLAILEICDGMQRFGGVFRNSLIFNIFFV